MIVSPKLRKQLSTISIEAAFGVQFKGKPNANTYCPWHEDPSISESKSCSVSREGLFRCAGCGKTGHAISFFAKVKGLAMRDAVSQLQAMGPPPATEVRAAKRSILNDMIPKCMAMLESRWDWMDYLRVERGLTDETIRRFQLGCDEARIVIPILDDTGKLINLRRYLPHAKGSPKMLSFAEGYGKHALYPVTALAKSGSIVLCEGEWDCMLLHQHGFNAITVTGGVKDWETGFTKALTDRNVIIIYDVNDKDNDLGQKIAWERARMLKAVTASVKVVRLPLPATYVGGDVTDWFVKEKRTAADLRQLIEAVPYFDIPASQDGTTAPGSGGPLAESEAREVTLNDASLALNYYSKIRFRCIVAGKGGAPYLPPREVQVEILEDGDSNQIIRKEFDVWDGTVLSLIQTTSVKQRAFIKALVGVPQGTAAKIDIISTFNVEEVYLIPAVDHTRDHGPYVMRKAFYIGHGLVTNRVYDFEGYTLPDPRSQAATHILTTAIPAETDIDTFILTPERRTAMEQTFSCATDEVADKLKDIAEQLADHATHIYGRDDLHTAVDLVFHSPLAFDLDRVRVHKGWLEILILGDTRTGKGFVTEGMVRHYGLGEVISGENVTLAGLIGGVQHVGDRWTLVWGKVPLADRRLVVIDESGGLSQNDISRLSRIRSEGIAEITKIISEKTTARTRLIWLANPRPQGEGVKRLLSDYNYGIEAVPELIGAAEDVARFDMAMIVAHGEVATELINKSHKPAGPLVYSTDLCRDLIMWVWSRKPEHIIISTHVTKFIMTAAQELARKFTPKISLVQGEDIRFKLARIACAVAARVFSTDDGERLIVHTSHVEFAYNFLHHIYSKRSCGYAQMSVADRESATLRDPHAIKATLESAGEHMLDLVDGLLEHRQIAARDLCDYSGLDIYEARSIISELVCHRALIKEYSWYVKRPAFKEYLRLLKVQLSPETNVTMPDDEGDDE